jgi:hypothetical protein
LLIFSDGLVAILGGPLEAAAFLHHHPVANVSRNPCDGIPPKEQRFKTFFLLHPQRTCW